MPRTTDNKVTSALLEFADATTAHGVPRAVGSFSVVRKIFWSAFFAASLAYFLYQASTLFNKYFDYPVATDVSVKFATIDFPAVTICNLNPIRLSKLKTAGGEFSSYLSDSDTAAPSSSPASRRKRDGESNQGDVPEYDVDWEDSYQPQEEKGEGHEQLRKRREAGSSADSSDSSSSSSAGSSSSSDSSSSYDSPSYYGGGWNSDYDGDLSSSDNEEYNEEFQLVKNFSSLILELNRTSRISMGHQYQDLILECAYNGRACSKKDFRLILDEKYGNCYTFNSDKVSLRKVKDPGPGHGLQTTMYIEQDEYVPAVTPAAGVRVVIHQPGEWPFPAEEGFDVGPGYSTSVGLQVTTIQRLGGKYGNCTDGRDKDNLYPGKLKYSTKTCWYTCFQRLLAKECGCGSRFIPLPEDIPACPVPVNFCEDFWTKEMRGGHIWCDCPPSCVDNTLSVTFGFSEWPADSYEASLRQKLSKIDKKVAEKLQTSYDARRNLLKLTVYFEQLNQQTISESPAYGVENLLGDLGGQLGLWVGVSVMTVLEVVELIVDIIQILLSKAKRSTKTTDISGQT
ncbi:amiloride-sensitive sodium channel subunit alpha-like [Branchiostoma lanceolatum]|uniref:amiloride-sensitive sodium channel subunit alpha-like n=1 Tax=Branchiostoma lanceolatum TaxID=7740 RepID=UPI003451FD4C